jgi:hypothetical protein
LLTYQHHFVDIVGGFVLAAICFYLFREPLTATEVYEETEQPAKKGVSITQ